MGLFGLFGPKKSAEQKAYEAALKSFPSKKVGIKELEAALKAWEASEGFQAQTWEAYFKIAIALDCGQNMPMDETAAKEYHEKNLAIVRKYGSAELKKWTDDFYFWYNQSSVNQYRQMDQQTLNVRRLGNAIMNVLGTTGDTCMLKEINKTLSDVYFHCSGEPSETAKAFWHYTNTCSSSKGQLVDHNAPNYNSQGMDVGIRDFEKRSIKEGKEQDKVLKEKMTYADMGSDIHRYIFGFQFFNKSPLNFAVAFDNIQNPVVFGFKRLFEAVYMGNSMALHKLVILTKTNKQAYQIAESVFTSQYRSFDAFLLNQLELCEKAGDYTATELINRYFTAED